MIILDDVIALSEVCEISASLSHIQYSGKIPISVQLKIKL